MTVSVTLSAPLDEPWYKGSPVISGLVPGLFDVALNGHPYQLQLDPTANEVWGVHFSRNSLPLVREQADNSSEPGEQSVSPNQFWRRSQQSWHKGAGQSWLDWPDADRDRFRSSKGVNPWTRKQLSLLNGTSRTFTSANSGLVLITAGSRIYLADGTALRYGTTSALGSTATGTPAATCSSIATDGFNVYAAFNASGIYKTDTGSSAATSYVTGTVSLVGYVKGRLMAANANNLYNITASGALPTALFTHPSTAFSWVGFASGPGFIYAAGYSGGHSEIYSIGIQNTATALAAPTIAAELPEGEVVRCIYGYAGFLIIGSDKGVRVAAVNSDGSLVMGGLISAPGSVRCMDGFDRFVWFGWTNYDSGSTGLGRVDLSQFTDTLIPAYASDLMATAQGTVGTTCLLAGARLFTVDGSGIWAETLNTPVTSGTLDSGYIGYDIVDRKQAVFLDLRHDALPTSCTVSLALSPDGGTFVTEGTSSSVGSTGPTSSFYAGGVTAERFEVRLTLTGSGSNSPVVTRYTLRADVTPQNTSEWTVPLIVADAVSPRGIDQHMAAQSEVEALISLHDTQVIFPYQEGTRTYQVKMTGFRWLPQQRSADIATRGDFSGTFIAQLRHVTG